MSHFLRRFHRVLSLTSLYFPLSTTMIPSVLVTGLEKVFPTWCTSPSSRDPEVSLRGKAANEHHLSKEVLLSRDFINHAAINHEQTHAFPVDATDEYRTLWHRKLNFNWPKFGGNNPRRRRTENDNALFHSLPSPNSSHHLNLSVRCTA